MNQKGIRLFLLATLTLLSPLSLRAHVTSYAAFKNVIYQQVDFDQPTEPDFPNVSFFGVELFSDTNAPFVITNASATAPDATTYNMSGPDLFNYFYSSPFFASKEDMDNTFPSGDYTFEIIETNGVMDFADLLIPDHELYAPEVPFFDGDTFTAIQAVDPTQPLTLSWNNFTPDPAASSAFIFVNLSDDNTGTNLNIGSFLTNTATCLIIPSNTLNNGISYVLHIDFSTRADYQNDGFFFFDPISGEIQGALGTAGFEMTTYTTLTTVAPLLQIAFDGTDLTLSWPSTAGNYNLESICDLTPGAAAWNAVTNVPVLMDTQYQVTKLPCKAMKFFRLHQKTNPI